MDKFTETMEKLEEMSKEERSKQLEALASECQCNECPTYRGTGEERLLFCATNKSPIIKEKEGCNCPDCPLVEKLGLKNNYYCIIGNEMTQRGK